MDQLKKWRIHAAKILSETGETVSNSTPTKSKRKQNKRSRAESIENSPDLSPTTSVAGLSDVETFSDVASNHSVEHVKKKQRMTLQSTHLGKELAVSLRNSPSGSDTRAMVQLPVSLDPGNVPMTDMMTLNIHLTRRHPCDNNGFVELSSNGRLFYTY